MTATGTDPGTAPVQGACDRVRKGAYSVLHRSDGDDVYAIVGQVAGAGQVTGAVNGRLSLAGYSYTDVNPDGTTALFADNVGNAFTGMRYT